MPAAQNPSQEGDDSLQEQIEEQNATCITLQRLLVKVEVKSSEGTGLRVASGFQNLSSSIKNFNILDLFLTHSCTI